MLSVITSYYHYFDLLPYPAVWIILPSLRTTSRLMTFSLIVPYRTAFVPEALVAAIPHKEASAPGSSVYLESTELSLIIHLEQMHVPVLFTINNEEMKFCYTLVTQHLYRYGGEMHDSIIIFSHLFKHSNISL